MDFESSERFAAITDKNENSASLTLKLIQAGCDIGLKNENNETYLHLTAKSFSSSVDTPFLVPIIFQLSNAGITQNSLDTNGNTALHIAAEKYGSHELVRAFIMIGIDPTTKNANGRTAQELAYEDAVVLLTLKTLHPGLWKAVELNADETILKLLGSWCKVDDKRDGKNLLDIATLLLADDILKELELSVVNTKLAHAALAKDKKRLKKN